MAIQFVFFCALLLSTAMSGQWSVIDESNALRTKVSAEVQSNESDEVAFGIINLGDSWEWYMKGIPVWSKVQFRIDASDIQDKKYRTSTKYNRHLISGLSGEESFISSIYSGEVLTLYVSKGQSTNPYTFQLSNARETIERVIEQTSVEKEKASTEIMNSPNSDDVCQMVEKMPFFDKCADKACSDKKLIKFIESNIKYPTSARRKGIEGRVFVQFIVEKDGMVSGAKIVRDIGEGCGKAALKVVEKMNTETKGWSPGMNKGQPVRVLYTLPVTFKFEEPKKTRKK